MAARHAFPDTSSLLHILQAAALPETAGTYAHWYIDAMSAICGLQFYTEGVFSVHRQVPGHRCLKVQLRCQHEAASFAAPLFETYKGVLGLITSVFAFVG